MLGAEGLSAANTAPTLLAYLFTLAWTFWLLVAARRTTAPAGAVSG